MKCQKVLTHKTILGPIDNRNKSLASLEVCGRVVDVSVRAEAAAAAHAALLVAATVVLWRRALHALALLRQPAVVDRQHPLHRPEVVEEAQALWQKHTRKQAIKYTLLNWDVRITCSTSQVSTSPP